MRSQLTGSMIQRCTAALALMLAMGAIDSFAGVSRAIQDRYRRSYENKALFLKLPIFAEKRYLYIVGKDLRPEPIPGSSPARIKVGDQVRILGLDFGRDEIKFKLSAITGPVTAEIVFKFESELEDSFPNSSVFDAALNSTFTEGLQYTDLEKAKRDYVEQQFELAVRDIANTGGTNRDFVLKSLAARIPALQDAQQDIENLKGRNQEITAQLSQAQTENRKLESDLRQQQAEITRLKNLNNSLQEKFDSSAAQLNRLGEDLRSARGQTQSYQSQLATLQRSLNIKVDEHRDLTSQIADLGQTMKKLQRDNESLEGQNSALRTSVQNLENTGKRLSGEIEDQKSTIGQLRETIATLTSKEDSLARQYLKLKQTKEHLENITTSINSLNLQIVEEKSEGGFRHRKVQTYLRDIPLGTFEIRLPEYISPGEAKNGQVRFSTDSIDYVKVSPEERHLLRTLGERLKVAVNLTSPESSMEVKPEKDSAPQEIGERDSAAWQWKIENRGSPDTRLLLSVHLINKNADEVPLLREEHLIQSASVVRQVRNYLQPIPISVGALLGFLLFGVVGIFRKGKKTKPPVKPAVKPDDPTVFMGQKRL